MAFQQLMCAGLLALLAACSMPERVVVETKEVKVPVPVMPTPPVELTTCGSTKPGFLFKPLPGTNDVVITADDQPAFRAWVEEKNKCILAFRIWIGQ